jgi:hypothetical protein
VKVEAKAPIATVKAAKGNINFMDQGNTLRVYTPTIRNTDSKIVGVKTFPADKAGATVDDSVKFIAVWNAATGKAEVRTKPGEAWQKGASYRLKLEFTLDGGAGNVYTNDLVIKPAQSAVKHALPKNIVMNQARAGIQNHITIDMAPRTPAGAKIAELGFKPERVAGKYLNNPNDAYWFYFDEGAQVLHLWLKDGASVKPGKSTLTFSVTYVGQGVEKKTGAQKPRDLKLQVNMAYYRRKAPRYKKILYFSYKRFAIYNRKALVYCCVLRLCFFRMTILES